MPDFNDATKLGTGKEMVDRLTNLISIFENKALDFSRNRAEGDDILGDAYEYLMRHFAAKRQEQGTVLHTSRSQQNNGADHRHPGCTNNKRHHSI